MFAPLGAAATLVAAARRRGTVPASATQVVPAEPVVAAPPTGHAPTASADELPIEGYDHLAASQVVDRLPALTPGELDAVAAYELAHRHRQSVLAKVAQLQG